MKICSLTGCAKSLHARGMCQMHYRRYMNHGTADDTHARVYGPEACEMDGCGGPHMARGYCFKHYKRVLKYGDPLGGEFHRREVIGYGGMHSRVRKARGPASDHSCVDCGGPAAEWAYDHSDPDELLDGRLPYSADPDRYVPRCVPCHRRFDLARRKRGDVHA